MTVDLKALREKAVARDADGYVNMIVGTEVILAMIERIEKVEALITEGVELLERSTQTASKRDTLVSDLVDEALQRGALGALMSDAKLAWKNQQIEEGWGPGAEFTVGHCQLTIEDFCKRVRQSLKEASDVE